MALLTADHELALLLSRELNANPERSSASRVRSLRSRDIITPAPETSSSTPGVPIPAVSMTTRPVDAATPAPEIPSPIPYLSTPAVSTPTQPVVIPTSSLEISVSTPRLPTLDAATRPSTSILELYAPAVDTAPPTPNASSTSLDPSTPATFAALPTSEVSSSALDSSTPAIDEQTSNSKRKIIKLRVSPPRSDTGISSPSAAATPVTLLPQNYLSPPASSNGSQTNALTPSQDSKKPSLESQALGNGQQGLHMEPTTPFTPLVAPDPIQHDVTAELPRPQPRKRKTKEPSSSRGKRRKVTEDGNDEPATEVLEPANAVSTPTRKRKEPKSQATKRGAINKQALSAQADKPLPVGAPPVWASKRQALCETLPYYRAYQSGVYIHEGMVRAFMVDKEVGDRDKLNEEVLIARVGGGRKADEDTGEMVQKSDQAKSSFSLGFERAMGVNHPVAVIAGKGNPRSPSQLPHYYNVLDWFQVTDVWCEIYRGFRCWMVRLEKIRLEVKSWWAPVTSPPLDPQRDLHAFQTSSKSCDACGKDSKEIFNAGWACLQTDCQAFFNFGHEVNNQELDYNDQFMGERTTFAGAAPLPPLVPPILTQKKLDSMNGSGTEAICYKGIVCPQCNGCSRRTDWKQWTCENGCSFTHAVVQKPIKVWEAMAQSQAEVTELCNFDFGIRSRQMPVGRYDVYEYIIPGETPDEVAGIVRLFKSNGTLNSRPDGPNDLFMQMQERDFGLVRKPARQGGSVGEILTSHFACNWGAPYKYSVAVQSKGFDEAPPVILKAVKRLTWAGEQTVKEQLDPFQPFNELLSIGYFENTDIGYHDDGEKELGPTVATLSLGAGAVMCFRPKKGANVGPKSKNAKGTKLDVLRIELEHGDMIVMHGNKIQKLYEHSVKPSGILRFALTCRYVRPELMVNDQERQSARIKGTMPDNHEQYNYDGDINITENPPPITDDVFKKALSIIKSGELSKSQLQQLAMEIQRFDN